MAARMDSRLASARAMRWSWASSASMSSGRERGSASNASSSAIPPVNILQTYTNICSCQGQARGFLAPGQPHWRAPAPRPGQHPQQRPIPKEFVDGGGPGDAPFVDVGLVVFGEGVEVVEVVDEHPERFGFAFG